MFAAAGFTRNADLWTLKGLKAKSLSNGVNLPHTRLNLSAPQDRFLKAGATL
jgi:hypothetical protein